MMVYIFRYMNLWRKSPKKGVLAINSRCVILLKPKRGDLYSWIRIFHRHLKKSNSIIISKLRLNKKHTWHFHYYIYRQHFIYHVILSSHMIQYNTSPCMITLNFHYFQCFLIFSVCKVNRYFRFSISLLHIKGDSIRHVVWKNCQCFRFFNSLPHMKGESINCNCLCSLQPHEFVKLYETKMNSQYI